MVLGLTLVPFGARAGCRLSKRCSRPLMAWHLPLSGLIGMLGAAAALAQVDPQVHQQCLNARDYSGCVQLHGGGERSAAPTKPLLKQLQQQQQIYLQAVQAAGRPNRFVGTIYNCQKLKRALAQFNAAVPKTYQLAYRGQFEAAVFGEVEACAPQSEAIEALINQLRAEE